MMRSRKSTPWLLAAMLLYVAGCAQTDVSEIYYLNEQPTCPSDHRRHVTEISFPHIDSPSADEAMATAPPRTISARHDDDVVEITLSEAVKTSLENNKIIRSANSFGSSGNPILANPTNTSSFYDSAILESGVLFGGRGIDSALAAFDATWRTSMSWNSDSQIVNNQLTSATTPNTQKTDGAGFRSELSKVFGYGGQFTVGHNWQYSGINPPANRFFQSAYAGQLLAEYRQPLWAGAGREFTSIAGPVSQNFSGLTGVTQGVLIARINGDISIADFEIDVRNMLFDVEQTYWDLYLAYRRYDTTVIAVRSAHQTWKESKIKLEIGTLKASDEAQARDRFYETRAQAETALATVFDTELRFRRLLGLKVNDGTILRPAEEPVSAEIVVDWQAALAEALTRRVELRKQKWNIKSLQLQLKAAKSLVHPSLDFNAGYHWNGFGDKLLSSQHANANSAFETLTQGNHPGWELGLTMNVPIGFRSALAQVRNIELRTAKAMDVLATQELEITHELGNAIQSLSQFHSVAKSNFNRLLAARVRVDKLRLELQEGTITPDPLVRAQASLATAETAYYESLTNYNKKLAEFHYRKGTLLANYNIYLSEGPWSNQALCDASRRAHERANAVADEHRHEEPASFAFPDFRAGQPVVELTAHEVPDSPAAEVENNPASDDSAEFEEFLPSTEAPLPDAPESPATNEPEVEDIPKSESDSVSGVDPALYFENAPSFDLREQDSFGLQDFVPEPEPVPVFDLRELPSRNATNEKPDTAIFGDHAALPVQKIQQIGAEFVSEISAARTPGRIPDSNDLQRVHAGKPRPVHSTRESTKPKLQNKTALTTKTSKPWQNTEPIGPSEDFQIWRADDPFWTNTSSSRSAAPRLPVVTQPVEFEDYQPKFHQTR